MTNTFPNKNNSENIFPGFPQSPDTNYWRYPKAMDGWWKEISPTEQKVLDYILRHTWGFQKEADSISITQFMKGIVKRDGTVLDTGTGIKSKKTVREALRALEKKGFITSKWVNGEASIFSLKIKSSKDQTPLPSFDIPPIPNISRTSTQNLVPTINKTIKNNNTTPSGKINNSSKTQISFLIGYLSEKLGGVRFPNYGKQCKYAKGMLDSGYRVDDVTWAIDQMYQNQWWRDSSFDLKNVADEIPKLMTRTFRKNKHE